MTKQCSKPVKVQLGFMGQNQAVSWCVMPHGHQGRCFDRWDMMALGKRLRRGKRKEAAPKKAR